MSKILIKQRPLLTRPENFQGVSTFVAQILARRGVASEQELELKLKHLLAPSMKGLPEAIQLMDQAIDQQKKIVIVGDYDADGATSTTLMILALREMGAHVQYLVPDRFKYGYGLTPAIADLAFERYAPDLLITVDNGISSHAGVECCHEFGMRVIITDHHLTTKATPNAEAVVNPNQLGCTFASKSLAGVGVAFYLLARLATHRQKLGKSSVRMTQFLDLVALGTVADVAKLDFNNRILVQAGLERIRQGQCRAGILALIEITGKNATQLQASDFGFVLGPRINAAGRMDSMQIGIECLLAPDLNSAYPYAYQLDRLNVERRQVEQGMREQAFDYLQQIHIEQEQLPEALVLFEPEWHQGVIGIVAGRLKEHFHRPSIVFALDEDGEHLKGSARSIAGIHIRDAIEAVAEQHPQLVKFFGGHAMAAGLTIQKDNFDAFRQAFIDVVAQVNSEVFQARIYTDGTLKKDELNLTFLQCLEQLGPWGQGFESPIFEGIFQVADYQWLKEKHLKLKLQIDASHSIDAIGFNFTEKIDNAEIAKKVRIAYSLERNEFRGQISLQLRLIHCENVF